RLGIGARQGDAHLPLRILDLGFALEAGRLFADLLLLVELGHAHGLLALGFAGADLLQLDGIGHLDGLFAVGLGNADLPVFFLLGDGDLGLLHGLGGGLAADRLDV